MSERSLVRKRPEGSCFSATSRTMLIWSAYTSCGWFDRFIRATGQLSQYTVRSRKNRMLSSPPSSSRFPQPTHPRTHAP